MRSTELLVIGAGPYGLSVAAHARQCGIDTVTVGTPMGFWREHMPAGMFLRSGPDWHLDVAGEHTFVAFLASRNLTPADADPIPIALYLDYTDWFMAQQQLPIDDVRVARLAPSGDGFVAEVNDGESIRADVVVAAPGIAQFAALPPWAAAVPPERGAHTANLVTFEDLRGARCLIIGGRQSAYEWAALLCDHGAERVDLVHRHDVPRFAAADWSFVDGYIGETLRTSGWWRSLQEREREAISRRFWEVGRLTLEPWIVPRLDTRVHQWPRNEVVHVEDDGAATRATLATGDRIEADFVVLATGFRADSRRCPTLRTWPAAASWSRTGFPYWTRRSPPRRQVSTSPASWLPRTSAPFSVSCVGPSRRRPWSSRTCCPGSDRRAALQDGSAREPARLSRWGNHTVATQPTHSAPSPMRA